MITFENVSKSYLSNKQQVAALKNINITIKENEIFGVVGESGSGKSTLLRLINGLEKPTKGKIIVEGKEISELDKKEQRKKRQSIGMIFQQFNLLGNKTVEENVALPLKLQKKSDSLIVEQMLEFVNLENKKQQYPQQLSGGEKQRVAIARALSIHPQILLCDEPTSSLDEQHTYEVMELLNDIHQTFKTTIVLVSHEFDVIKYLCHRVGIMEEGELLEIIDGKPSQQQVVYANYHERARALLL